MKKVKSCFIVFAAVLLAALSACKAPVPEIELSKSVFEVGESVDLSKLVSVVEAGRIDPERYTVLPAKGNTLNTSAVGTQEIEFIIHDIKSGKEYSSFKTVEVEDTVAPSLVCKQETVQINFGAEYDVLDNVKYADLGTPDRKDAKFVVSTALDSSVPGVYEVKVSASDASGNERSVSFYVEVVKRKVFMEIGQVYQEDGLEFELLLADFMDTVIPENPGTVYSYLPSQSKYGNTFYAVRMRIKLIGEGPVNLKSFFSGSRFFIYTTPYSFDMKADADGNITSNVTLERGESGIFYIVFVVPENTPESQELTYFVLPSFKNTIYSYVVHANA